MSLFAELWRRRGEGYSVARVKKKGTDLFFEEKRDGFIFHSAQTSGLENKSVPFSVVPFSVHREAVEMTEFRNFTLKVSELRYHFAQTKKPRRR